jgi:hypothetical protein
MRVIKYQGKQTKSYDVMSDRICSIHLCLKLPFEHRTIFPKIIEEIVQFSDDEHSYS